MNALFDEQNNLVAEFAAESIVPSITYDLISIQHEGLLLEKLDQQISAIGGSVHGHTLIISKEENT